MTIRHYIQKELARHWHPKRTIGIIEADINQELFTRGEGFASALGGQEGKDLFDKYEHYDTLERSRPGKKQKMTADDGMWRARQDNQAMNVDTGPSGHAGPTHSKPMRKSRYHNTLGVKYRKRCKKTTKEIGETSGNTFDKTLVITNLVNVTYSGNEYEDDKRNGYQCYVKGVKLQCCWKVKPGQTVLANPITIRWAIMVPETNTGATSDIAVSDFFINRSTTTDEFEDFPSTGNYLKYHGRAINTSKYGIMKSGTFTLGPSTTGMDSYTHWDQTKLMNIWVPLRRVFQWDNITTGVGDDEPTSNLHLVWWYTDRGDLEDLKQYGPTGGTGPIIYNVLKTTFFKNVHL